MKTKILVALFITILLCLTQLHLSTASVVKRMTIEEMTTEAKIILQGKVTLVESEWNYNHTQILTLVRMTVTEWIKGELQQSEMTLRILGGTVGDTTLYIVDVPQFRVEEEVLLFVRSGSIPIVGISQGKFIIETDPKTGKKILKDGEIYLDDFINGIKGIINLKGEDRNGHSLNFDLENSFEQSLSPDPFRILGPNPGAAGDIVRNLDPNEMPPFLHWDLREFKDCKVPWSVSWPVPDLDGDGTPNLAMDKLFAQVAFDSAFIAWEKAEPAIIRFMWGTSGDYIPGVRKGLELDQYNILGWNPSGRDDEWAIPNIDTGSTVGPFVVIIDAGDNGFLETQPRGDDQIGFGGNNINAGGDGVVNTRPNNQDVGSYYAITGIFFDNSTGGIIESDILFDSSEVWRIVAHGDVPPAGTNDVRTVATHEIGHFIGIAHSADAGNLNPAPNPIMNPGYDNTAASNHLLSPDDILACDFLYTPDLGDAPDPKYPSKVHGTTKTRELSGVDLYTMDDGAEHLFGYWALYQYEWLGDRVDDHPEECEYRKVDKFDDGVRFSVTAAGNLRIKATVKTRKDADNEFHDYGPAPGQHLYFNVWVDWNNNGNWDDMGEHVIIGKVVDPVTVGDDVEVDEEVGIKKGAKDGWWTRSRLDWGENCIIPGTDGTLSSTRGAAQFGEVEDHRVFKDSMDWYEPEYHGIEVPDHGYASDYILIYNFGPDTVNGTVSSTDSWIQNIDPSSFNVPPGEHPHVVTFDIDASTYYETYLVGNIHISSNPAMAVAEDTIPVHVVVSDSFVEPEFVSISNPTYVLSVSNTGNLGHLSDTAGLYLHQDPSEPNFLYDGSPIVGFISPDDDTVVGRYIFSEPYLLPATDLNVDTSAELKTIVAETEFWPIRMQIPPADQYWPWWRVKMRDYIFYSESPGNKNEQYLALKVLELFHDGPPDWWVEVTPPDSVPQTYLGMLLDIDAPSDSGYWNYPFIDSTRRMAYLQGYGGDNENYLMGIAQRDSCSEFGSYTVCWPDPNTVTQPAQPYAMHLLRNDAFLYPQGGYEDDSLYKYMSDSGYSVYGDGSPEDYTILAVGLEYETDILEPIYKFSVAYALVVSDDGVGKLNNCVDMIMCGNVNRDGAITIADAVYYINYLFRAGPEIWTYMGDANADGYATVSDVVYLINYLFRDGPPPMCSSL